MPRPEQPLRIWLGSGGSPESVAGAVELGVPLFLGILGATPEHWAHYGRAYRDAWAQVGHPAEAADIAVAVHGFVGADDRQAKASAARAPSHQEGSGLLRSRKLPGGRAPLCGENTRVQAQRRVRIGESEDRLTPSSGCPVVISHARAGPGRSD